MNQVRLIIAIAVAFLVGLAAIVLVLTIIAVANTPTDISRTVGIDPTTLRSTTATN
jgi:hypothetical protein